MSPYAALPLGILWLIGGSLVVEAFISCYAYWQLSEVFDDIGETVDPPILQSPSPVTGILQIIRRRVKRHFWKHEKDE